jgi:phosphate ABC transporter phosphate-binding protein
VVDWKTRGLANVRWLLKVSSHGRGPRAHPSLGAVGTLTDTALCRHRSIARFCPSNRCVRGGNSRCEFNLPSIERGGWNGSTLLYPLFTVWASEYAKAHPGVRISTTATSSSVGIEQATSGAAHIGASDAYMTDAQIKQNPQIINVPMAISAQTVNYNGPDFNTANPKFDGPVLAGIYTGKIRTWGDKAIAALNSGVKLPHNDIIPIHRAVGSGDTFIFTQYLTFSTPSWENGQGFGTTIKWPAVPGGLEAIGNPGMVEKIEQTPYSIGYVDVSFYADIAKAKLGTAALKSYSGEFLLPTAESAALSPRTPPDQWLTLVNAPGPTPTLSSITSTQSFRPSKRARQLRPHCGNSCSGPSLRAKRIKYTWMKHTLSRYRPIFGCLATIKSR